jgi:hypothetical protein
MRAWRRRCERGRSGEGGEGREAVAEGDAEKAELVA